MATGKALANVTAPSPLTDSSGGTASDTIAAIGSTYAQAEVRNAVASLAAKVNALTALVNTLSAELQARGWMAR